jgi:hypothetical protein
VPAEVEDENADGDHDMQKMLSAFERWDGIILVLFDKLQTYYTSDF